MTAAAILYDPSLEIPEADERETDREINEALRKIREATLYSSGRPLRSVHAKSHGVLHGELTVVDGLPEVLAQGLFAKAARYDVVMRFSTTPGDVLDDGFGIAHQIANIFTEDLVYLAISMNEPNEVVSYPDSGKIMVRALQKVGILAEAEYMAGEPGPPKIFALAAKSD